MTTEIAYEQGDSVPASSPMAVEAATPNGFAALGLAPELLQAVADLGFTQPTEVQQRAIGLALGTDDAQGRGSDLMVSSQTGSGKTAAFLLPVLHTILQQRAAQAERERAEYEAAAAQAAERGEAPPKRSKRKNPLHPRNFKAAVPGALVLCPTRELAQQVAHDAIDLVKHCKGLRIANVVGGMPYQMQIAKLQNADLVVATPGRLLDLQRSLQIKLDEVQFLVVDEADRMLDLGFADDLAEVNQLTAQRRQTMMFSATFAPRIQQLAMRVMNEGGANVKKVQVDSPQEKHANIRQSLYWADNADHKRKLLDHWLRDSSIDQAIVFASTQIECDGLAQDLQQAGFAAVALHGALSQGLRNRRLMALRKGQVKFLVATDVAARGIDVPTITHVFNYGLPMKAEDYTHRIGRTGRAGRDGLAITFAEFRDRRKIFDIEGYTHQALAAAVVEGLEPTQRFEQRSPRRQGFDGRGRGGRDSFGGRGGPGERFGGERRRFDQGEPREQRGWRSDRGAGFGPQGGGRGGERAPSHGAPYGERRDERFAGARPERRFDRPAGAGYAAQRPEHGGWAGAQRQETRQEYRHDHPRDARGPRGDSGERRFGGDAPRSAWAGGAGRPAPAGARRGESDRRPYEARARAPRQPR